MTIIVLSYKIFIGGDANGQQKRNVIVGQSGGPTSVINSSLAGVYKMQLREGLIKYMVCCMVFRAF